VKEEALDCILWRTQFGRGYGPVIRQQCMNEWMIITARYLILLQSITLRRQGLA